MEDGRAMASGASIQPAKPAAAPGDSGGGPVDFGAQFGASFRSLWVVAIGIVQNRTQAEDVIQEAALIALSKMHTFKPGTNFSAWMARIVEFVARNQARSSRRRRASELDEGAHVAPADPQTGGAPRGAGPELGRDQTYFDDRVMRALRKLDETPRLCLLLRTMENLEYSEISRLLNIPEGTAMSHVHRVRKALREELADLAPRTGSMRGANV